MLRVKTSRQVIEDTPISQSFYKNLFLLDWCCLTAGPSSLNRQGDCKNVKMSSELDLKTGQPLRAVKLALRPPCSLWAKGVQALILFVQFRLPPRTSYSSDPWRPLLILKPASQCVSPDCGETQALTWLVFPTWFPQ